MITFEEFYKKLDGLHVGQEAYVYVDGESTPCSYFKKCEEYGNEFFLYFDVSLEEFSLIQSTRFWNEKDILREYYYDDWCEFADDLKLEVKNREFFTISEVSREDLQEQGFDTSNVDDATMDELADRLGEDYCEQLFWISLEIIAEEGLNIPRNCEDEEDEDS